jgi:hypothetical protein
MLRLPEEMGLLFPVARGYSVGALDQIAHLPYVVFWGPGVVFVAVAGGLCWLSRRSLAYAETDVSTITSAQPPVIPKRQEQRGSTRRQGSIVEVHVALPDEKKQPGTGTVLDRSVGGVRLALPREFEVGAVLSIHPINADNMVPWVDVEVRSCKVSTEMAGQFELGCQYVKSPPYSIQLLFG